MFRRARLRLTAVYIVMLALVLVLFSAVFYAALVVVLQPAFDIAPELSNTEAARLAYDATIERIAIGLALANGVAICVIGVLAWILSARTLEPIREAHQRQQRFVADASHEIRNPLTAIKSSAEAGLRGDSTPDELRASLESVVAAADRLVALTNDLLSLARPDASVARPPDVCDLSVTAAEALEAYLPGDTAGIEFAFAADLPVAANPGEVGRIVRNLVENAFRHGGRGVRVSVATLALDRDAILEVTDDGPGISEADTERIFAPFHRLRAAHGTEGTGLGLAIAADLAARNGGRVTVRSAVGRGSTFRVSFPCAR
ncbi:MAG: sensor histidine kinase [Chloroflexota bacterium]